MFVNTTVLMPLIFDNHPTLPLQEDVQTSGLANPETAVLAPPRLRLHHLRHTHASLMLSKGIRLKIVSERLGHSSIAITANIYSHVLPSVQQEAVDRFGAQWNKENGKSDLTASKIR